MYVSSHVLLHPGNTIFADLCHFVCLKLIGRNNELTIHEIIGQTPNYKTAFIRDTTLLKIFENPQNCKSAVTIFFYFIHQIHLKMIYDNSNILTMRSTHILYISIHRFITRHIISNDAYFFLIKLHCVIETIDIQQREIIHNIA